MVDILIKIFVLPQMLEQRHTDYRTFVMFLDIKVTIGSLDKIVLWNCVLKKSMFKKIDVFDTTTPCLYCPTCPMESGRFAQPRHSSTILVMIKFWKQLWLK